MQGKNFSVIILGSASGVEPLFQDCHHTSVMLLVNGSTYLFDTGENCAHTAHIMHLPLNELRCIFYTHLHLDHTCGLPHLLFTLKKLQSVGLFDLSGKQINFFLPPNGDKLFNAAITFFNEGCKGSGLGFTPQFNEIKPGVIFQDENISVEAIYSRHRPIPRAFSYRIRGNGKTLVLSGDVKDFLDLSPFFEETCDEVLMETGHHDPLLVAEQTAKIPQIRHLTFYHHGRTILHHRDEIQKKLETILPGRVTISKDKTILTIQ